MTHAAQDHTRRSPVLFGRAAVVEGSIDEDARTVEFIASTEAIDGHGTIVKQNWRLERYAANPVVLYGHNQWDIPLGTGEARVVEGKLRAKVKFSTEDLNPEAEKVWKNVRAKVIRGMSAGFLPHNITFERHEDREVMVLDDNELYELSITPCPSNAESLAQYRSMATRSAPVATVGDPVTVVTPPIEAPQTPPIPDGTASTSPIVEENSMSNDPKDPKDPTNTVSVARALGLPAGATEQDAIARSVALRELEVLLLALTGEKSVDGAIGAVRGMVGAADKLKATNAELATVKAERDLQNFEALVAQGRADSKLTPAEETFEREEFQRATGDGRGAAAVERLRGMLKVKAADVRFTRSSSQPTSAAGSGSPLLHDGKAYKELSYAQRAKLAKEQPELWKLMKADHEAQSA